LKKNRKSRKQRKKIKENKKQIGTRITKKAPTVESIENLTEREKTIHLAKHIFITLSYVFLAIGVLIFEWSIFTILFSYLLEFITLILLFSVSNFATSTKVKYQHDNRLNVIGGAIPLVIFNYIIIVVISNSIEKKLIFPEIGVNYFLEEILPSSIMIIAGYVLSVVKLPRDLIKNVLSNNLKYQALCLTGINIFGLIIFSGFFTANRLIIIITLIAMRILLEWIFEKQMRII